MGLRKWSHWFRQHLKYLPLSCRCCDKQTYTHSDYLRKQLQEENPQLNINFLIREMGRQNEDMIGANPTKWRHTLWEIRHSLLKNWFLVLCHFLSLFQTEGLNWTWRLEAPTGNGFLGVHYINGDTWSRKMNLKTFVFILHYIQITVSTCCTEFLF